MTYTATIHMRPAVTFGDGPLPIPRIQQSAYAALRGPLGSALACVECQRLEPAADLSGAMAATIARLEGEGWRPEATPEYGFVFIRREGERRLLSLTPRDPYDTAAHSFSPFRDDVRP